MPVLSDADRRVEWGKCMSDLSSRRESTGVLTKDDIRSAVNAVDTWIDDNQGSFNAALPLPARTVLTAKQKAKLLMQIIRRRFEVT